MSPSDNERETQMSRYIIHPGTLTVIDADECLILDIDTDLSDEERDKLDGDDYFDDALICEYAERYGSKMKVEVCDNCGTAVTADDGNLCEACFEKLPTGEWHTAGNW